MLAPFELPPLLPPVFPELPPLSEEEPDDLSLLEPVALLLSAEPEPELPDEPFLAPLSLPLVGGCERPWVGVALVVAGLARRTREKVLVLEVFVLEVFELVVLGTFELGWEERERSVPPEAEGASGVTAGVGVGVGGGLGVGAEIGCVEGFVFLGAGFDTTVETGVTTVSATGAFTGAATGTCDVVTTVCTGAATVDGALKRTRVAIVFGLAASFEPCRVGIAAARMTLDDEPAATTRVGSDPFEPDVRSQRGARIEPANATGRTRSRTLCVKPSLNAVPPPPDKTIDA